MIIHFALQLMMIFVARTKAQRCRAYPIAALEWALKVKREANDVLLICKDGMSEVFTHYPAA